MAFRNQATGEYPVSEQDVRRANPNTSYPPNFTEAIGFDWVVSQPYPQFNSLTEYVSEDAPVFDGSEWRQVWVVNNYSPEQSAANQAAADTALYDGIVLATQQRLDTFAQERGYDSILSACTYASSSVAKFAAEGQYCVDSRDATWDALLAMLAEVQAGTRPKPSGFADIEPELPVLAWPAP